MAHLSTFVIQENTLFPLREMPPVWQAQHQIERPLPLKSLESDDHLSDEYKTGIISWYHLDKYPFLSGLSQLPCKTQDVFSRIHQWLCQYFDGNSPVLFEPIFDGLPRVKKRNRNVKSTNIHVKA